MAPEDRDDGTDDTVRQAPADLHRSDPALRPAAGLRAAEASADTLIAGPAPAPALASASVPVPAPAAAAPETPSSLTVPPLPPVPSIGATPQTRPLGRRGSATALAGTALGAGSSGATAAAVAALSAGDSGRYEVGALLGQGGMGEVLLATDVHIGREVAVKRIRGENPSPEELSRFLREARVQGRLEHPAVVPVHDLGIDRDGRPYFVMKRLTGTDMGELLKRLRTGEVSDEAARRRLLLRAFADVCLAVEFAHSRGIIHRDLKPANIMLGDFGEVYVLDWGVARALTDAPAEASGEDAPAARTGTGTNPSSVSSSQDLALDTGDTRVGTVLGTPPYMAPEQLAGERAGPAADTYALGCILYEIACGEQLHARTRSIGQAFQPIDARPSQKRPDSPPELDAICERATRIALDERYPSARALGGAVQAYLDGDRDLAARRELARQHIALAREALARGDEEQDRRDAMRAAGRALSLDPTATEAADLVTHLMLTPPRTVPDEVEHRLDAIDTETGRSQGRLAAAAMMGYLGFVPLLLWTGVRDVLPVIAFAVLAVISSVHVYALTRRPGISEARIYLNAGINALLIALICRMVGPFIIAPTLVTTTLMAYAAHARFGRIQIVGAILTAAVAVPWALEAAGVLPPTYRFSGGDLVLSSDIVWFSAAPVQLAFAILLVTLVGVVAILSRTIARRQREATRRLELQAWHLRQIVPTAPT